MTSSLQPSQNFPDLILPDHQGDTVRLLQFTAADEFGKRLGFTDGRPLIVVFYRGFFCPRDRVQLSKLITFYPEVVLNHAGLVAISVDPPLVVAAYRAELGASFPFLSDHERAAITQLGVEFAIVEGPSGRYAVDVRVTAL